MFAKTVLTKERLVELYVNRKMSQAEIAGLFGLSHRSIGNRLVKWKIPMRSRMEAIQLAYSLKKHSGLHNPNWKGGRYNHKGYWLVLDPEHHRANKAGYVLEHIKVWEQTHGREVPKRWHVHHVNGSKKDNRPENLVAVSDRKHRRVIPLLQKRIRNLEKRLSGDVGSPVMKSRS